MKDKFAIGELVSLVYEPNSIWEIIANKYQPYTDDYEPPKTKQWSVARGTDYLLKMTLKSQREKNGLYSEKLEPYVSVREAEVITNKI